jgi:hypothetical protein
MSIKLNKEQMDDLNSRLLRYEGLGGYAETFINHINNVLGIKDRFIEVPLQEDGLTVDITCKDYNLLERMHKQESWTDDQQRHYEAGWEAALNFLLKDKQ